MRQREKGLLSGLNDDKYQTIRLLDEGDIVEVCWLFWIEYQSTLIDHSEALALWLMVCYSTGMGLSI